MTEKQERILTTALRLFAEHGYDATSTSKVAKEAGVSEGLIFRHFTNKEGLLAAILQEGSERATTMYTHILSQPDPKQVLKGILELPFQVPDGEFHFWKLLYGLKWQADVYDESLSAPVKEALIRAFGVLEYTDPQAEAETVLMLLDGIVTAVLLRQPKNLDAVREVILTKYDLIEL